MKIVFRTKDALEQVGDYSFVTEKIFVVRRPIIDDAALATFRLTEEMHFRTYEWQGETDTDGNRIYQEV